MKKRMQGFAALHFLSYGVSDLLGRVATSPHKGDGSQKSEQQDVLQQGRNTHAVLRGDK